jgi:CHAT domain-containing protein
MRLRRRNTFRLLVVTVVLISACQADGPPALSLEEAKQVTTSFAGRTFVPPPRTINDITTILDQQKQADPEAAARAYAKANAEPPPGIKGAALTRFLWKRGLAAGMIGYVERQISDLTEAIRVLGDSNWETRQDILADLATAETMIGNFADSVRHRKEFVAAIPASQPEFGLGRTSILAMSYARSGDLDAADRLVADVERKIGQANPEVQRKWERVWMISLYWAKGDIAQMRGRYVEAESMYRSALDTSETELRVNPNSDHNRKYGARTNETSRSKLAANLTRQGRLSEAEIEARKALSATLARLGRFSTSTAARLLVLTTVISEQGRHGEAEKLAHAVIDIYRKIGADDGSMVLAKARIKLAESLANQGRWDEVLTEFETVKAGLASQPGIYEKFFSGNLTWPLALLRVGRAAEARSVAEAAVVRHVKSVGAKHHNTAMARAVLGMAQMNLNQAPAALAEFSAAVPILLSRSRQSDDDSTSRQARGTRLRSILGSYIALLAGIRGTEVERDAKIDAAAEAFRIADVARGHSVQRALTASGTRAMSGNPDLADLARREQDSQRQIAGLHALLANVLSSPLDQQDPEAVKSLRTNIDHLRGARAALMEEIETRFPEYARLINPKPATLAQARAVIDPGEALIATYVGANQTFVWAVPHTGDAAFAAVDLGHEDLDDTVALLRSALEPNATTVGEIPAYDVAAAHGLFTKLLEPVKDGWADATDLLVVAHGPLGYLPLSLLPTAPVHIPAEKVPLFANYRDVPWLARGHAVTVLPSVASLRTLRGLPPGNPGRKAFAGFGDPLFSVGQATEEIAEVATLSGRGLATRSLPVHLRAAPDTAGLDSAELARLPRLPDTADEIRSSAIALGADLSTDVFLGSQANEHIVKTMDLSGYKVLAFATHGLVPGDLNGLTQPALALSAPQVAGVEGDGLLTMGEILGLKLDADWVVLSACNSGSGQGAGAEAVSGLGRAFFYAGTRALLVSNWPVETTSARVLTTDLFRRQREDAALTRAQALRRTMLGMIDGPGYVDAKTGKTVFSYAHPIFWAPFSLVGDGGGAKPQS